MQETLVRTLTLPSLFLGTSNAAPIAKGGAVPVRAEIYNAGPVPVILTTATQDVRSAGALSGGLSQTRRLPPGETTVFVLKDKHALYAGAAGAGGEVTASISAALPLV